MGEGSSRNLSLFAILFVTPSLLCSSRLASPFAAATDAMEDSSEDHNDEMKMLNKTMDVGGKVGGRQRGKSGREKKEQKAGERRYTIQEETREGRCGMTERDG